MTQYTITARPTKYALRPINTTVDGVKAKNKWLKLYKANGWVASATANKA